LWKIEGISHIILYHIIQAQEFTFTDAVESAETPKSKHKTMCYNNDEIKEKKNIIQNGSEKKEKKRKRIQLLGTN